MALRRILVDEDEIPFLVNGLKMLTGELGGHPDYESTKEITEDLVRRLAGSPPDRAAATIGDVVLWCTQIEMTVRQLYDTSGLSATARSSIVFYVGAYLDKLQKAYEQLIDNEGIEGQP